MNSRTKRENLIGKYSLKTFPKNRRILSDIYDEFLKKHYMTGLLEVDITYSKNLINKYYDKTGNRISFVSWIAKCVADSIAKYPELNSFRKGKSRLIQFDDVDIIVMIEKQLPDKVIPVPHSIRKCNEKDLVEISNEIRKVQTEKSEERDQLLEQGWILNLYNILPKFIRQKFVRRMIKNPFYIKKAGGLVVITSISIFTKSPGWVTGFGGMLTMSISLGGKRTIKEQINGKIEERELLQMTIDIDHDIIDGAPATRFVSTLVKYIESGYLLLEL